MPSKAQKRPRLIEVPRLVPTSKGKTAPRTASPLNQFEQAYEAIEERLVRCELAPGRYLAWQALQELQQMVGFGRTPVHQAVSRLAADTLITVHPRRGLQVAPIDLARERVLLQLRRDMERFVIRLACERSSAMHRNQMLHLKRQLTDSRDAVTLESFNSFDRRLDRLFLGIADIGIIAGPMGVEVLSREDAEFEEEA